jgi:hypothetical protein
MILGVCFIYISSYVEQFRSLDEEPAYELVINIREVAVERHDGKHSENHMQAGTCVASRKTAELFNTQGRRRIVTGNVQVDKIRGGESVSRFEKFDFLLGLKVTFNSV